MQHSRSAYPRTPSKPGLARCAVDPHPLVVLLRDRQVRERRGHHPPRRGAGDDTVLGKVRLPGRLAEEVLVQEQAAVDRLGVGAEDRQYGVGEDCLPDKG